MEPLRLLHWPLIGRGDFRGVDLTAVAVQLEFLFFQPFCIRSASAPRDIFDSGHFHFAFQTR